MWTGLAKTLLLASASARRVDLLIQPNISCQQIIVPGQGEDEPRHANEDVVQYVQRTSDEKNIRKQMFIKGSKPDPAELPILSADTTVAIGQEIFGKPFDVADARRILTAFSASTHDVYSTVTQHWHNKTTRALSHSQVTFDPYLIDGLEHNVATGEPFGKAGAYAIQGQASTYIRHMTGSYSGSIGLPVFETCRLLRASGVLQ
ncbi:MAG: Maf family protein [Burkholderiales bacterium]|jgi:septum formation protein|nr:Maf family protein [Burkholderiales bacterium]